MRFATGAAIDTLALAATTGTKAWRCTAETSAAVARASRSTHLHLFGQGTQSSTWPTRQCQAVQLIGSHALRFCVWVLHTLALGCLVRRAITSKAPPALEPVATASRFLHPGLAHCTALFAPNHVPCACGNMSHHLLSPFPQPFWTLEGQAAALVARPVLCLQALTELAHVVRLALRVPSAAA